MKRFHLEIPSFVLPHFPKQNLGIKNAFLLRRVGIEIAKEEGLKEGFLVVSGRRDLFRLTAKIGDDPRPQFKEMARAKTVMVHTGRRSVVVTRDMMSTNGYEMQNYGPVYAKGTNIPGGVAVYADAKHEQYIGSVAFSGGKALEQDQKIAKQAIEKVGLYTDLPSEPTTQEPPKA